VESIAVESVGPALAMSRWPSRLASSFSFFFFKDASPDTPALNGCVPRDKQGTELLRRNQSTESAWFAPHQAQAHGAGEDGGYEDINLVSTMHALAMGSPARWCTGSMRRTARLEDRSTNRRGHYS